MKNALAIMAFIGVANPIFADDLTPTPFTMTYTGEQAQFLFEHLDERLQTSSIISEGVQRVMKTGWSMECWQDTAAVMEEENPPQPETTATDLSPKSTQSPEESIEAIDGEIEDRTYGCSQLFFDYGYTSNTALNYNIPEPDSDGPESSYLLIEYSGSLASRLHGLLAYEFPLDLEQCSLETPCITSEDFNEDLLVLSVARGPDLSCYELTDVAGTLSFSCSHYLADQDGAVIPVGGDPLIGVVLGGLRLEEVDP